MATQTGSIDLTATRAVHFAAEAGFESINGNLTNNYYTKSEFSIEPGQIASVVKEKAEQSAAPNLSPYFSHPFSDFYSATDNPDGYWAGAAPSYWTQLTDGWVHCERTSGSSTTWANYYVHLIPDWLKPSTKYTFLVEWRNATIVGNSVSIAVVTDMTSELDCFAGGTKNTGAITTSEGSKYITVETLSDFSQAVLFSRGYVSCGANCSFIGDIRISIYEGEYDGPYKPYVDQSLTTRMSSAETSITQNATDITLRATKEESYQMGQPNLVPWFSAGVPQLPSTYWKYGDGSAASMIQMTDMGDGWCHMVLDNSAGTGTVRYDYDPVMAEGIELGKDYTFLFEFRNIGQSIGTNTQVYAVQAGTYGMQFWGNNAQKVLQGTGVSCTTYLDQTIAQSGEHYAVLCDDGVYRKRIVRKSEASNSSYWTRSNDKRCVRLVTYCGAGGIFDAEFRFSIYEGEYEGPYKPYSGIKLYASQAELKVANDRITSEVSAREALGETVSEHTTLIEQNATDITLSAQKADRLLTFVPTRHTRNDTWFWYSLPATSWTLLDDGWAHYEYANTGGQTNTYIAPKDWGQVIPGEQYTFLIEIRNYSGETASTSTFLYIQQMDGAQFWGGDANKCNGRSSIGSGTYVYYDELASGSFTKRFVKTADTDHIGDDKANNGMCFRIRIILPASKTTSFDMRVSVYPGDYEGPYNEYITATSSAQLKVASDEISAKVDKNGVIAAINLSAEQEGGSLAKISADKVNIEGAAIFTSGRLSDSALASVRLTLTRNNWSDSQWTTYETIGSNANWKNYHVAKGGATSATGFSSNTLRVGDLVVVEGVSTDTGNTHRVTIKVTQVPSGAGSDIPATTVNAVNSNGIADNIHVGGRNLLLNTSDQWSEWITPTANTNNITKYWFMTKNGELSTWASIGQDVSCSFEIEFSGVTTSTSGSFRVYSQDCFCSVANGTLDGTNKTGWNDGAAIRGGNAMNYTTAPADGVYQFKNTVAFAANHTSQYALVFSIRCDYWGSGKYRIRKVKYELGNKPTDWTPASNTGTGGRNYAKTNVSTGMAVTTNGVTFTVTGPSSVRINGTATATSMPSNSWFGGLTLEQGIYSVWLTNTNNGTVYFRIGKGESKTHVYSTLGNYNRNSPYILTVTESDTYWFGPVCVAGTYSNVETSYMLERSDKATDWTPAPEDQTAYVDSSVDGIQVGGRNLLPGTQDWSGANKRTNGTYTVTSDTYGGCSVMTQVWGSGNCDLGYQSNVWTQPLEADTWYTLSFWAKASANVDLNSYLFSSNVIDKSVNSSGRTATSTDGAISNSITTSWQRIWVSWHIKADATAFPQQLIITRLQSTHSGVTAYIAGAKLEKGNKASDWTPAPEETVKRTQRIYYRTDSSGAPATPNTTSSSWVVNGNTSSWTKYKAWSTRVPPIADSTTSTTKYPYLYTCEQREMGDGTLAYTTVLLDDSTTVIDGGNIITGSVATNTLTAYDATIGKISAEAIDLRGVQPAGEYATSSALTTEINQRKAQYGTCSTAVGTTPKVVTCSNFELVAGNELTVKFSNANTSAAKIQLNVNSKGAKDVWVANAVTSATNQLLWGAGAYITFRYDGTQFQVIGEPRTWYGASTTAEGTAAKTDTTAVTGCVICKGAKVELAMSNANTASAPTLNVQSTGAKAVYFGNGTTRPTKAGGTSWLAANTCTFTFDGAAWRTQGKTYIDANSIVTGYLSADRIEAGSLGAEKINVSSISIGDLSGSVGGRNLLRWTDKKYYAGQWNKGTAPVDTYGWYRYSTAMPGEVTDEGIKFTHSSSSTRDGIVMYLAEDNVVVGGEDLVLSFDYRTNVTTFFTPYLLVAETGNIQHDTEMACTESATNWVHGSWKLKFPSTASKTVRALLFGYINNNGGWIEIKSGTLKLERGSRETDWTPAPEDFTAYVDAVQLGVTNLLLETATWGSKLWYDKSGAAIDGDTVTYASNNTSNRMALIPCSSGDVFTVSYDVKASVAITYGASGGSILVDYSNSATSYNRVVYDLVAANSSVGTEWQRVSYTFTVPTNSSIKALTIGLRNMSPSTSCTLYFRHFKLERGSRATDWTPAPEDVVSDINAVQSNLDNFQVGGRNLIKKSADLNECFNATAGVSSIVSGKADPDGGTGAYLLTPNNTTTWYSGPNSSNCLLKNTSVPYTFSIWLRADTATQCKLCCRYMDSTPYSSNATRAVFDVTTEWQRFYISGPLKQVQTSDSVWIGQVTNVPIYAYHPKVEIGTRPTDWTPAKEDVDASIDSVQSDLDMSRSWYAECPTAAATTAKVATITPTTTSFTTETLTPGTIVHVKFAATNSGSASSLTLNVNGTGAKPIKYVASGGSIANIPGNGYLIINNTYEFYYDGTNWVVQMPYNTNNYDRENYKAAVAASAAISAGRIAVFGTDHKLKTLAASAFDVSCPILYVATEYKADDVTKGTARSTNYTFWGSTFTLTNTHSIQGAAAGKPVFIVGKLNGTTFTPNATVLTCTIPTTAEAADNNVYLRLGLMSTATAAVLESDHPMYMFFDGKFQQCDPATASAACSATTYLTDITGGGVMVHPSGDDTTGWKIADALELLKGGASHFKVWLDNSIAKVRVGLESSGHITLDNDSMDVYTDSSTVVASFGANLLELGKNKMSTAIEFCAGKLSLSYYHDDTDSTGIQYGRLFSLRGMKVWSGYENDSTNGDFVSSVGASADQGLLISSLSSYKESVSSNTAANNGKAYTEATVATPSSGNLQPSVVTGVSLGKDGTSAYQTATMKFGMSGLSINGVGMTVDSTPIKAIYIGSDVFTLSNGQWMQLKSASQVATLLGSGASLTNTICIAQNGDFNTYAGVVTGAMGQDGSARAYIYPNRTGGIRINYMLIRFA